MATMLSVNRCLVSEFHKSKAWRKLAADHKTLRCICCNSKTDIESAHYLPQKRFPMMRLWRSNLYYSCKACNGKLGNRIKWSTQAVKLLGIYMLIKAIRIAIAAGVIFTLGYYYYLDTYYNAGTLTDQMKYDFIMYYEKLRGLA